MVVDRGLTYSEGRASIVESDSIAGPRGKGVGATPATGDRRGRWDGRRALNDEDALHATPTCIPAGAHPASRAGQRRAAPPEPGPGPSRRPLSALPGTPRRHPTGGRAHGYGASHGRQTGVGSPVPPPTHPATRRALLSVPSPSQAPTCGLLRRSDGGAEVAGRRASRATGAAGPERAASTGPDVGHGPPAPPGAGTESSRREEVGDRRRRRGRPVTEGAGGRKPFTSERRYPG